jgi:hypothetical protein
MEGLLKEMEMQDNLISNLENENRIIRGQRDFLMQMIEWMVEAHGNSETLDYLFNPKHESVPWKLKDYVRDTLKDDYEIIDYRNKVSKADADKK